MRRALLSVTDKTGIESLGKTLKELGFQLISTGGTARALREAGIEVTDISEVTGVPEMLDGRVKTLHPNVHGGLLADVREQTHRDQLTQHGIEAIQLLVVNLYRFEETVTGEHDFADAIESIDIGGPAMIRSAAKNHANVLVVTDPDDYDAALNALRDTVTEAFRIQMAAKAFAHTAFYDSMIARYLGSLAPAHESTATFGFRKVDDLRYGENPHQVAAVLADPLGVPGIVQACQTWGIPLSYNNYLDADAAWELVNDLPSTACAIIKHGNPCGAAAAGSFAEAYRVARESDPISAFGGIAAFNGEVDEEAARAMTEKGNFLEVVVGTRFTGSAAAMFQERSGWGQNVRLLEAPLIGSGRRQQIRSIGGGILIQDLNEDPNSDWDVVTEKAPTEDQIVALRFAWALVKHVKSNAIVIAGRDRLLGVGAGQMNRVQSVRLAIEQAGEGTRGAALASDAFFPFPDSIETAAKAGIAAIVQPGGSKKDPDVIAAANQFGLAMVFTGIRHFRH